MPENSDYIVYVDESGDPNLKTIEDTHPVFVLTFCIIKKSTYIRHIVPDIQDLKFTSFGHDAVILHAYDIRQKENDFAFLMNQEKSEVFFDRLNTIMEESSCVLVCSVIKKADYARSEQVQKGRGRDIYHMALQFCMERLYDFLRAKGQDGRLTHIIVERRGKGEDKMLEEEFQKILKNYYDYTRKYRRAYKNTPMKIKFAHKQANSTGLQLADLIGYPVGRHVLRPEQENRAYAILEGKFFRKGGKRIGLKIFPK